MKSVVIVAFIAMAAGLPARADGRKLRDVFRKVSASVVVVRTMEKVPAPEGFIEAPGQGSGVVVSTTGKVLTAAHVVHNTGRVTVELMNGEQVPARVIGSVERADVAALQLERVPPGLVAASVADSDGVEVGDDLFVVGAPYGIGHTLTAGHMSGRRAAGGTIDGVRLELLQTDAAVNTGNSGGPVFNLDGEVVGIVSHILTRSGGFEGLSFAVTSNVARRLLLGRPTFWTGVDAVLLTSHAASAFNLPQPAGLLVQRVADGSPAADLGIRAGLIPITIGGETLIAGGDVVLEVGGIAVTGDDGAFEKVFRYLTALKPGDPIVLKVLREGRIVPLSGIARSL
jgi:S1-C subfamily serine protease